MDIKFIKYLFIFWLICFANYSYSQGALGALSTKPIPTPVYIASYVNPTPTPTITPIPLPDFNDCMSSCLQSSYPIGEFPFAYCFSASAQGGILGGCIIACQYSALILPAALPGCIGGCYAMGLATCMGIGLVEMTATATGCASGCL